MVGTETFVDPLLSAPMVEKEYAFDRFGSGDSSGSESIQEQTDNEGIEPVENETVTETVTEDTSSSGNTEVQTPTNPSTPPPPQQSSIPNMSFIDDDEDDPTGFEEEQQGGEQSESGGNFDMPDEEAKESAEMIAELVLDLYQNELPKLLHKTSKIPVQNIQVAEALGRVGQGTTQLIEDLNKRNKEQLKVPNEHRKMIKKPLVKVLTARGISVSPEAGLIIALIISAMSLFMSWREIKTQNDNLINSILERAMTK